MCGICGQVGSRPDVGRLQSAMERMVHRGPDQAGSWLGPGVMLGHRRLAVIDLSNDACQPMASEDLTVRLVFNGEIYNFPALRRELESRHRFRSRSDSEVLVHGYEEWGIEGLLRRVSGMFAFALWDSTRGVLHLARDRLGKKPLFYAHTGGELAFASTLPALLDLLPGTPEADPVAVAEYLVHLCVPGSRSIVSGVSKLPPGHRAEFRRDGTFLVERFWRLSFADQEKHSEAEWLDRIDTELRRAIKERLVSDVPLGVFLSGGVDSSLVAALAAQEAQGRLTTISAGFEEAAYDETPHARRVATHLGTEHHELLVRASDAAILPMLVHAVGEPFADQALLPTLFLAREARRTVTVVLTGDGGDESFAGYSNIFAARAAPFYKLLPEQLRRGSVSHLLERLHARGGTLGTVGQKLRALTAPSSGSAVEWLFDPLGRRGFRGRLDGLLTDDFKARIAGHDPDEHWRRTWAEADGPTLIDRALYTELSALLPDMYLAKADSGTMAFGVEARAPLLDAGVVELAARIPAGVKVKGLQTKRLLRMLGARYMPAEMLNRRKQGFVLPTSLWMRGALGEATAAILLSEAAWRRGIFAPAAVRVLLQDHREGRADHGQRLWTLLQLELWMQMYLDRTLSQHDLLPTGIRAAAA